MNTTTTTGRVVRHALIVVGIIAGFVLLALSGATAAKSHADAETTDEIAFIMTLDAEGIPYSSEDAALAVGYGTCDLIREGATLNQIVAAGVRATNGGYDTGTVAYITGAAVAAFCPELDYLMGA